MPYRLGLTLAIVVILGLVGLSEAACRADGEYRVTGPNVSGSLTLTETASDTESSSGTVVLFLGPKRACPVCLRLLTFTYLGDYSASPNWEGACSLSLTLRDPVEPASERRAVVGGSLTFGGSVILFGPYDSFLVTQGVDLNLTLGIRTDSLVRP